MAFAVADRVRETTTTTGTGTLNLDGAVSGFRTFVSGIGDGNVTYYAIVHRTSAEFEIGIGTVTDASTDTLSRTTVLSSSNSNSAVTFSAGTKDVFCTQPASKAVFEDNNADVTLPDDLILGSDSAVLKFGADSDTTLTHTDGTGLTLNSTNKLTFGDAASFVQQSSNGVLRIDGEATIDLNASTAVTVSNDLKLDSDSAVLGFGADNDITITHAADTGLTVNGTFTATGFIIGSANINEAELETIDGVTAGTVAASKAVVVDSNKDIGSFRNVTLTGELDAATLDISGDADIDGTLETDALSINGTAVTSTAAELNLVDGITAGTVSASLAVIVDSNKDITGFRNVTLTGELDAATLDISGNADIDGTTNLDNTDIDGTLVVDGSNISLDSTSTLNIDNSNTSNGITIGTATSGVPISIGHTTSEVTVNDNLTVTGDLTVSGTTTTVNSTTVNLNDHNIVLDTGNTTSAVINGAGITIEGGSGDDATFTYNTSGPKFELKLGSSHEDLQIDQLIAASLDISGDVDVDGTLETDALSINGTAVTSTAAELNLVDGITAGTVSASLAVIADSNKDVSGFRNITLTGELDAATLDISGNADIDGTLEADAITVDGTALATLIAATTVTNSTNAAHISVADNESTNENNLIPFIEDASATGNVGLESDGDFTYNPSTGRLTATQLAGTLQTAAQANITSLGTLTTLTVDNVIINGTTIGHTDDTDLITVADGIATVAGEISVTTLDIGGTNVTSTAAELNILDGVTATASELNLLDGNTSVGSSITLANGDGIVTNDGGTMKTIPASDIKTYVGAAAGAFSIANLDIDGGTDIGADLVGDDLIIVDDGAGGTNRKATLTRLMTFVNANVSGGGGSTAADDISAGDAAVNLTTTSGNITIDAQANDSDIIFKGTDGGADTTFLTIDGSDAGKALFNAGATFSSNVSISTADNTDTLTLISTDADANAGPVLNLQRDSGSPADDDLVGSIRYSADNDAGEQTNIFQTNVFLADASDGSEDFQFEMDGMIAGTQRNFLTMSAGAIIFNEDAQDIDFRVESSGNANAFKVDAGNDKIVVDVSFDLNDNKRIRLGDSNDLQIYHSGSSSYILNDTGDLTLDLAADLVIDADGADIRFQDGGSGIGRFSNSSSDFVMQVDSQDKDILFKGDDGGAAITGVQFDMSDAGAIICKGNVTAFGSPSDIRLKENIEVIPNALDKVSELRGVTFNYKKDGKKSTGLIAQELEKVLPEVVYDTHEIDNDDEQFKAVRYGNVVGLLVEAIKELKTEVEELKKG